MVTNTESAGQTLDGVFDPLADGDRRRLLGLLHHRAPEPSTTRELGTRLVDREAAEARRGTDAFRQARLVLHHVHLPNPERAGLIDLDPDRDEVALADHRAFDDGRIDEGPENVEANLPF